MKYEFAHLESLCRNGIAPLSNVNDKSHEDIIRSFLEEISRIKIQFKNKVFASENERNIERYIQDHQKVLIELSDALHIYKNSGSDLINSQQEQQDYLKLCETINAGLEELLTYIQDYFKTYFNLDEKVPAATENIVVNEITAGYKNLMLIFADKKFEPTLSSIILNTLNHFTNTGLKAGITFRNGLYVKNLIDELTRVLNVQLDNLTSIKQVSNLLIYLNFNSVLFFDYYTTQINKSLESESTLENRLTRLAYEYKLINQKQIKSGCIFDINYPSIKDQLSEWIMEEISYLERKQQLTLALPSSIVKHNKEDFKILIDLSVAQFACLTRLLIEGGIIKNKNITELLRFLSSIVKTKRSDNVSKDSFRMKYYNVESTTNDSVKETLKKLINNSL